jgi:electron transfer flavoprotein beta subunit
MKIVVVLRQVPDLNEPLEVADSGRSLDWNEVGFLTNESDDHALEQAILMKERGEATVTVVALDFGEVDNALYAGVAKGADRIVKIPLDEDEPPSEHAAAAMFAEVIKGLEADVVMIGCWAHNELEGALGARMAETLKLPYLGVVRGVELTDDSCVLRAYKEYPGAVRAQMSVRLPAVLGIQRADQPPRYVPVNRIREAMKETSFDEQKVAAPEVAAGMTITRLYLPDPAERAEMIEGSEEEVAARIAEILETKGLIR